jgi:hypothetical protein
MYTSESPGYALTRLSRDRSAASQYAQPVVEKSSASTTRFASLAIGGASEQFATNTAMPASNVNRAAFFIMTLMVEALPPAVN